MIDKTEDVTCFDYLKNCKPDAYDQDIRGVMGKMLFQGDDAFKKISKLSGGETARLIFAKLMLLENNVLILDEPNNHLDLESVAALIWGIENFTGTVLIAAHDRDLIDNIATRIIAFEKDGIHPFDGPLEEYIASKRA